MKTTKRRETESKPTVPPAPIVVVLSDLHVGSTKALCPEGYVTVEGNSISHNPIQGWLYECWIRANNYIAEVVNGDDYVLVINGDLIEGIHHGTKEIWSPEIGDHAIACHKLLAPLAEASSRVFVVRGTEAHVNNHEGAIGAKLGAEVNPELGIAAFDRLTLDVRGVRCVFRHHIGTSVRRGLAGTQLSMQLAEEQVEAACNGEPIPRILVCSHRHKPGIYRDNVGMTLVTPAWQCLTRFAHKVVSQARCTPGVQILDWRGCAPGELPRVHEKYYQTPHPKAFAID